MVLMNTNYCCALSQVAFQSIMDSIREDTELIKGYIAIVDGDAHGIHNVLKSVYEMRRKGKVVYMVTLISQDRKCSPIIWHLSDYVIEKKITYCELKELIGSMLRSKPKHLSDNVFGDILGEIFKVSHKENGVLELLLAGRSQSEISQLLNISVKTVSAYKIRSIRRHGVRNFNELYMLKQNNSHY